MFFAGAVLPGEGKQYFLTQTGEHLAGWPSPLGEGRNFGVSPLHAPTPPASSKDALLRRASLSGWGREDAGGETATLSLCYSARGPGLEDARGSREPQGRAKIHLHRTPRPGSPAPSALKSAPAAPLPLDLAGHLIPGMERQGTAVQPRRARGSDPGRSPGEEAEEKERLWAAPAGGFYLARGKSGVASVTAALETF